jgi:triacylglycerol esterase/lipase EstA (alpha/beta hydrolase family)
VPGSTLAAALHCPSTFTHRAHEPVLLVHGTFFDGKTNYASNYLPALTKLGFDVCYVDMPDGAMGDAQVSSEYVAYAVRAMHAATRRKVDMLGVSQGGLEERWAVKWWPDVRADLDDVVMNASPNHGTMASSGAETFGHCFASCWQMAPDSKFTAALNAGDETPGAISYTSTFTDFDELVYPQMPKSTSALAGARNIRIQDICPGRPTDHTAISTGDAVAFAIAVDAFTHPGPANPARIPKSTCEKTSMDGADYQAGTKAFLAYAQHRPPYHDRTSEPPLKPYAR